MARPRSQVVPTVLLAALVLCVPAPFGCERAPRAGVTATQPRTSAPQQQPAEQPAPGGAGSSSAPAEAEPPPTTRPEPVPIDMDEPQQPEPPLPPYVFVVERIDPHQRGRVRANTVAPNRLELTTDNVRRLRLTRERLPLSRHRSIVLRIDGQGIEWTPKCLAVELQRSPAGAWTVVRRRLVEP